MAPWKSVKMRFEAFFFFLYAWYMHSHAVLYFQIITYTMHLFSVDNCSWIKPLTFTNGGIFSLSFTEVSISTTQCVSLKAACLLNTLMSFISCIYNIVKPQLVHCCSHSGPLPPFFQLRRVWLFFTSNLIALIEKSPSSDSQLRVCGLIGEVWLNVK